MSLYKSIISNFDPAFIFYQDYISGKWVRLSLPTQYEGWGIHSIFVEDIEISFPNV